MSPSDERTRGLPSLKHSRDQRRRAVVLGKVRFREAAPNFWIWTVVLFCAFGVVYWHYSERKLQSQKSAVMAKQRAIAQQLGPRLFPVREQVDAWVTSLAGDWKNRVVHQRLDLDDLSRSKGLYLRLLRRDAGSSEDIKEASQRSLHDGFTSCLFVRQEAMGGAGSKKCYSPSNCGPGELCNEWNVCAPPSQPFNLRLVYKTMRVLSSDWTDDLHRASGDYDVRLFERDLEKVSHTDVPITIELLTSAKFLTVVLDEEPKGGVPQLSEGDAGVTRRPELQIQGLDHYARVGIWEIASQELLFRSREFAGASFVGVGRRGNAVSSESRAAQQRQVNNCSIAQAIRERVAKERATGEESTQARAAEAGGGGPAKP